MLGIGFIIIGAVILLQVFGVLSGISAGVIWGSVFILVGVSILIRREARRARRARWIAEHRERKAPAGSASEVQK